MLSMFSKYASMVSQPFCVRLTVVTGFFLLEMLADVHQLRLFESRKVLGEVAHAEARKSMDGQVARAAGAI